MAMEGVIHSHGAIRLTASAEIAANCLACYHTVAGQAAVAGVSASNPVANLITYDLVASGAVGDFYPLASGDRVLVKSSASIAIGDLCKGAASGEVAPEADIDTLTAATIGVAVTAGAGSSGLFWMQVK